MGKTVVIGDIHGWREKLETLLVDNHLVTDDLVWWAGDTTLIFIGDYVDRGPDGIGTIDLIMRLQKQASNAGGRVIALLGNHDVLLLAAHFLGRAASGGPNRHFYDDWIYNGGTVHDLKQLTPVHIEWLMSLPAMVKLDDTLFLHADATFYTTYGTTVETVSAAFSNVMRGRDLQAWDKILDDFSEHQAFLKMEQAAIRRFLQPYGAKRLIHGHTPVHKMTGQAPEAVKKPFIYADGLCVNVDQCFYAGGSGFVYTV